MIEYGYPSAIVSGYWSSIYTPPVADPLHPRVRQRLTLTQSVSVVKILNLSVVQNLELSQDIQRLATLNLAPENMLSLSQQVDKTATLNRSATSNLVFSQTALADSSSADTTPPTFLSITIEPDGQTVTIVMSESVTQTIFSAGVFSFHDGYNSNLAYQGGDGTDTLTFLCGDGGTQAVFYVGETPKFAYDAIHGDLKDLVGNLAVGVSFVTVTNNSTRAKPTITAAVVPANGRELDVTFSESVTRGGGPANWNVSINGSTLPATWHLTTNPSNVHTLDMPSIVKVNSTVTLSSSGPGSDFVDTDGDEYVAISNFSCTNNSQALPNIVSVVIQPDGVTWVITWEAAISSGGSTAGWSNSLIAVFDSRIQPSSTEIRLTTNGRVVGSHETGITISYIGGSGEQDSFSNPIQSQGPIAVTNNSLMDTIPPTLINAVIDTDGVTLYLTFSENMAVNSSVSGWGVRINGASTTVPSALNCSGGTTADGTLPTTVLTGDSVTIEYSGLGTWEDSPGGNNIQSFSGFIVTNNSTQ